MLFFFFLTVATSIPSLSASGVNHPSPVGAVTVSSEASPPAIQTSGTVFGGVAATTTWPTNKTWENYIFTSGICYNPTFSVEGYDNSAWISFYIDGAFMSRCQSLISSRCPNRWYQCAVSTQFRDLTIPRRGLFSINERFKVQGRLVDRRCCCGNVLYQPSNSATTYAAFGSVTLTCSPLPVSWLKCNSGPSCNVSKTLDLTACTKLSEMHFKTITPWGLEPCVSREYLVVEVETSQNIWEFSCTCSPSKTYFSSCDPFFGHHDAIWFDPTRGNTTVRAYRGVAYGWSFVSTGGYYVILTIDLACRSAVEPGIVEKIVVGALATIGIVIALACGMCLVLVGYIHELSAREKHMYSSRKSSDEGQKYQAEVEINLELAYKSQLEFEEKNCLCRACALLKSCMTHQRFGIFVGIVLSAVDMVTDIGLFAQWNVSGLQDWAAIGFTFLVLSNVQGALTVAGNELNPKKFLSGLLDLGGIWYFLEAGHLDSFSYDLAFRLHEYEDAELIESIPSSVLGLYIIVGATILPERIGFGDVSLTSILTWLQLLSSMRTLGAQIVGNVLFSSPNREKYEGLKSLGFRFQLIIYIFAATEFIHRTVGISLLLLDRSVGGVFFFMLFTVIVGGLHMWWADYTFERSVSMSLFTMSQILQHFIIGLNELFVPIWTHMACFDMDSPWTHNSTKLLRGLYVARWICSLVVLVRAAITSHHGWVYVWCGVGLLSLIISATIFIAQIQCLMERQKAIYKSNHSAERCDDCEITLRGEVMFTLEALMKQYRSCQACSRDIYPVETVFFCSNAFSTPKPHTFYFVCAECVHRNQRQRRSKTSSLRIKRFTCGCGERLKREYNVVPVTKVCTKTVDASSGCSECKNAIYVSEMFFYCDSDRCDAGEDGFRLCQRCAIQGQRMDQ